jgi:hypothetical protein
MRNLFVLISLLILSISAGAQKVRFIVRNDSVFAFDTQTRTFQFQFKVSAVGQSSAVAAGQGTGGTVTQATNKSTGVTINKLMGQITTHSAALAAGAEVKFTVTNNQVAATDVPQVAISSGGTSGSYLIAVTAVSAGSFDITLTNASTGSLSQPVVINFNIFKAVNN